MNIFDEVLPIILSSAGLSGSIIAAIVTASIKKAREDAERKRRERLRLEILRLEGEEKLSKALFALMRYSRGIGSEEELDEAERAYSEYLEKSSKAKNEIIGASAFD
ncbi:MAG: hypothetical protein IKT34_01210 [Clostridia bacterium]|nr:hypothetical protein [Clostridia bacterium]